MGRNNEVPYIPKRDPRDVNVVERIKSLANHKAVFVDDEDLQVDDVERVIMTALEKEIGEPGGFVILGEDGLIDPKYLPPSSGGAAVRTASTHYEFPTVGTDEVVYIATDENDGQGYIYRWCTVENCYKRPDDDLGNVSEIYGGSAEGF